MAPRGEGEGGGEMVEEGDMGGKASGCAEYMEGLPSGSVEGRWRSEGDKSLSHRALWLASMAVGESRLRGLSRGGDVRSTRGALEALGVRIEDGEGDETRVIGVGTGGFLEPEGVLDAGNSGTTARFALGALATWGGYAVLDGDGSLRRRPMGRVTEALELLGARYWTRGGRLPVSLRGFGGVPAGYGWRLETSSAQVKTALLLAGLGCIGDVWVEEPGRSRDHTERMLGVFGAEIFGEEREGGYWRVTLGGERVLRGAEGRVSGDPSSGAFLAAAVCAAGGRATLEGLCVNPLRMGFYRVLERMGARVSVEERGESFGEPTGDVTVEASRGGLRGVLVSAREFPGMVDEYPALAVLAASASGETRMEGVGELRVKESDRAGAAVRGLRANGVEAREEGDVLVVKGGVVMGGGEVDARGDHRMAMAFTVLGLGSREGVRVRSGGSVGSSFPGFGESLRGLGCEVRWW